MPPRLEMSDPALSLDRARRMEALLMWVRAVVVVINSAIFLLGVRADAPNYGVAVIVMGAAAAYAASVLAFRPYVRWPMMNASLFTTCTDCVFITLWVLVTGGAHSEFYLLYYVSVASIAIRYSLRESLIAAAAHSICYAGLLIFLTPDPGGLLLSVVIRTAYVWFIAAIVGGLAREERNRAVEYTEIVRLHRDLEQAQAALEYQALHDPLTGLANRRQFDTRLRASIETAGQGAHDVALLVLDLDRFKDVNDTLGHQAGDDLLCEVADRLRGSARAGDLVARLGGDEFALILAPAGPTEATAAARRVLAALEAPIILEGRSFDTGVSIGIAGFPIDACDPVLLVRLADLAMYTAKRGRTGFSYFEATLADSAAAA